MVARVVAVVLAVVACVWFAVGIRQAHDTGAATSLLSGSSPLSPAQARRAASLLHDAGQLNPDRTVDLLRSQLALRRGDAARARAIALGVTRSEPQNIQAWIAYGRASSGDRPAFVLALRRLNQLAPPVHP
jgi:hypothetical protein